MGRERESERCSDVFLKGEGREGGRKGGGQRKVPDRPTHRRKRPAERAEKERMSVGRAREERSERTCGLRAPTSFVKGG